MQDGKLKMLRVVLITLAWLTQTASATEELTVLQTDIAKQYYQALYAGDFDTVRRVASADLKFADPSAPHEFGIPAQLNDLESFLAFMQVNLPSNIDILLSDSFVSNNRVVFTVSSKGSIPAKAAGMEGEGQLEFSAKGISILHVVDGKVIQHTDYFDYPALAKSFKPVD